MRLNYFLGLAVVLISGVLWPAPGRAQTWVPTSVAGGSQSSITLSPDGRKLVVAGESTLYVSTNFGTTWITHNPGGLGIFYPVTSADGTIWLAEDLDLNLHLSTNSADSWTGIGMYGPFGFGVSADGGTLLAADASQIDVSINRGSSKTTLGMPNSIHSNRFKAAANGGKWFVFNLSEPFQLNTSSDWGATWTTNSLPSTNLLSFAVSADATRIIAGEQRHITTNGSLLNLPGSIYVSYDSGASWFPTTAPSNFWTAVASSADGTHLVAAASPMSGQFSQYTGGIFTSADGGITWVSNSLPTANWVSVTSSADGCRLAAIPSSGFAYVAQLPCNPTVAINLADSNAILSWTLPSTNVSLHQSPDLTSTNWSPVTNSPTFNFTNLQYQVVWPAGPNPAFFRLSSP